jgi:hypothetical protein
MTRAAGRQRRRHHDRIEGRPSASPFARANTPTCAPLNSASRLIPEGQPVDRPSQDQSLQTAVREALHAHGIKPDYIKGVLAHLDLFARALSQNGEPDAQAIEAYAARLSAQPGYTKPDGDGAAPSGGAGGAAGLAEARRRFGNQPGWPPRGRD